jgi:hypothetical protein
MQDDVMKSCMQHIANVQKLNELGRIKWTKLDTSGESTKFKSYTGYAACYNINIAQAEGEIYLGMIACLTTESPTVINLPQDVAKSLYMSAVTKV